MKQGHFAPADLSCSPFSISKDVALQPLPEAVPFSFWADGPGWGHQNYSLIPICCRDPPSLPEAVKSGVAS